MNYRKVFGVALLVCCITNKTSASDESLFIDGGYVQKKTASTLSSALMKKGSQTLSSGFRTYSGPWRGMTNQYLWFEKGEANDALYLRVNGMREMELCDSFAKNIPFQVTGLQRTPEIKRTLITTGHLRCEPLQISSYPYIDSYPLIEIRNASEIFEYFWDLSAVNFQFELDSLARPHWPKKFDLVFTAMGFRKSYADFKK